MKRAVITGATGFIGINMIKALIKKNYEVYAVVRRQSSNISRIPSNEKVHIVELNMGQYAELPQHIESADLFFHFAWDGVRSPKRDDKKIQKKNYEYSIEAFEAACQLGCYFFLGSGSQAEYGITKGIVDESYPCNPITEYGKQKLRTYLDLKRRAASVGIRFVWTRIFSLYGPFDSKHTLVMSAIKKMLRNEPVELTDCTQMWDYLYIEDAVDAMLLLEKTQCACGVYIVASGKYKRLREFVELMKETLKSQSDLRFSEFPYGLAGPIDLMPRPQKLMELGWNPGISFEEGIKLIVESLSL